MSRLTVCVAIPTIPGRELLAERALNSAKAQSRKFDQLIIERDSERTGAAAARTRLLDRVETDLIAWLDDDDWLLPTHLNYCLRRFERKLGSLEKAPDLVYPIPKVMGRDPTAVTHQGRIRAPWGLRFDPEAEAHLRRNGSFIPMTHVVRTDLVREIGGFHEGYTLDSGRYRGEDEDYLIRLLDHGAIFEHLPYKTWVWNAHPATSTAGRGGQHGR